MTVYPWTEGEVVVFLREGNKTLVECISGQLSEESVKRIWRQLTDQVSGHGFNNLGVLFDLGVGGVEKNPDRAIKCYAQAADLGSYIACENLGFLHEERQDEQEALKWWKRGAELRLKQGKKEETRIFSGRSQNQTCWSRKFFLDIITERRSESDNARS